MLGVKHLGEQPEVGGVQRSVASTPSSDVITGDSSKRGRAGYRFFGVDRSFVTAPHTTRKWLLFMYGEAATWTFTF
jgi:hypothetical protein